MFNCAENTDIHVQVPPAPVPTARVLTVCPRPETDGGEEAAVCSYTCLHLALVGTMGKPHVGAQKTFGEPCVGPPWATVPPTGGGANTALTRQLMR